MFGINRNRVEKDIAAEAIAHYMLNHPNLPAGGPGRAFDGQFALSEFKVKAVSVQDPTQSVEVKLYLV